MRPLLFAVLLALLLPLSPSRLAAQTDTVLHISVQLSGSDGASIPMRGVVLLVSDNPPSGEPKRVTVSADGTIDLNLRPGNYTVESDLPVAFQGQAYQWTQFVDVPAGRRVSLELTAKNAEVGPLTAAAKTVDAGSIALFTERQSSVLQLWSPTAHATGFVIDASGLILTNQRAIGGATAVQVQLTPAIKVAGRVLVADQTRDLAIVWVDPQVVAAIAPLTVTCGAVRARANPDPEIFALTAPLFAPKDMSWGTMMDLRLGRGSSGGPVFARDGALIGVTTDDDLDRTSRASARVIPITYACEPIAAARKKMAGQAPPPNTLLPVEPATMTRARIEAAVPQKPAPRADQPPLSAADFDIAIGLPPEGAQRSGQSGAAVDFGAWEDYVRQAPSLLYVRAIPKFEEPLLMTVARGAASTQGMALPPIKRFKASFLRMRAYCGDTEVTPIHGFTIERSPDEKQSIKEGLYVFDPAALGPQCPSARLVLFSEKQPDKGDTKAIEPSLLKPAADPGRR